MCICTLLAGAVAFVSSVSLRVFLAEVPSRLELLLPTRRLETKTSRFTLGINSSQNIRRSVQYLSYIDNDSRTSARFLLTIFIRVLHRTNLSTENTSALYRVHAPALPSVSTVMSNSKRHSHTHKLTQQSS